MMDIGFLNRAYNEYTHQMMERLIKDIDFINIFHEFNSDSLVTIAEQFDHTIPTNNNWDLMTSRERKEWSDEFNKIFKRFIELLETSPCLPSTWGFPIKDNNLMKMLHLMGLYEISLDKQQYWIDTLFYESKTELLEWTIIDSLKHYKKNIELGLSKQPLSKPRDPKAQRALFIKLLHDQNFKTKQITIITRSAFLDENLDERTVRRLIKGGVDFSEL